ncbi:MAG: dihydroneopterin aldolase [Pseudomonadota bacterium]
MDSSNTALGSPDFHGVDLHREAGHTNRIFVRDYICSAEIGAYSSERGVTQRLQFNVVLDVAHHAAACDDDVDQVVSYDMIVRAIERLLREERLDLLETLAERLAQSCLDDIRVSRAHVRVEKLDRIAGALGVEIVRSRIGPETLRLRSEEGRAPNPSHSDIVDVIFLGRDAQAHGRAWLDVIAERAHPAVLCVAADGKVPAPSTRNARRIGYLEIERNALALADLAPRFRVVSSRTEIEWSFGEEIWPIWAPARMAEAALEGHVPNATDPLKLARWFCEQIRGRLILVNDSQTPTGEAVHLPPDDPLSLLQLSWPV